MWLAIISFALGAVAATLALAYFFHGQYRHGSWIGLVQVLAIPVAGLLATVGLAVLFAAP